MKIESLTELGFLYLDHGVNRVHFGIVNIIRKKDRNLIAKDKEVTNARFMSIGELEKLCSKISTIEVEDWSRSLVKPLKGYLDNSKTVNYIY